MEEAVGPAAKGLALVGRGLRFLLGRHLAVVEHLDDLRPGLRVPPHVGEGGEAFEVQLSLLLLGRVAFHAELLQHGSDRGVVFRRQPGERVRPGGSAGTDEAEKEQ